MREKFSKTVDVIIVDDRDKWRDILLEILQPIGCSVLSIDNFEDAKSVINNTEFKLAILDLNMDDGDEKKREGLDLLNLMDDLSVEGKALIITGFGREEDKQKAEQSPRLIDFIYKNDVDIVALRDLVKYIII